MGASEKLCLQWNDFNENIISSFRELREDRDFTDVTLACEDGQQIEAHKVVLASASPVFMKLLKKNKHPHPLIYMRIEGPQVRRTDGDSGLSLPGWSKCFSRTSGFLSCLGWRIETERTYWRCWIWKGTNPWDTATEQKSPSEAGKYAKIPATFIKIKLWKYNFKWVIWYNNSCSDKW